MNLLTAIKNSMQEPGVKLYSHNFGSSSYTRFKSDEKLAYYVLDCLKRQHNLSTKDLPVFALRLAGSMGNIEYTLKNEPEGFVHGLYIGPDGPFIESKIKPLQIEETDKKVCKVTTDYWSDSKKGQLYSAEEVRQSDDLLLQAFFCSESVKTLKLERGITYSIVNNASSSEPVHLQPVLTKGSEEDPFL